MNADRNILIAVDDSEISTRAVTYVATMIGGQGGFHVCLLHILPSMPPELLEVGGSENPEIEEQEERDIKRQQDAWLKSAEHQAEPLFERARGILRRAGVSAASVETQVVVPVSGETIVTDILEAARTRQCRTVVVGRESFRGLKAFFSHHIGDELVRQGQGMSIWVTE